MSYHITCDRCGRIIDLTIFSDEAPDSKSTVALTLRTGEMETFDLHKRCADEFRAEFANWVKRSKTNPPL